MANSITQKFELRLIFSYTLKPSKISINETCWWALISLNILQNVEGIPSGKKYYKKCNVHLSNNPFYAIIKTVRNVLLERQHRKP